MKEFFSDSVLLSTPVAEELYSAVKDLPIVDYHCHLSEKEIAENRPFTNLGELWLGGDHYKWRAMRLCGVDEHYITGDATWREKFDKFAEIFPKLCGNPLYYWAQLELKLFFGITLPLNPENADAIWEATEKALSKMTVGDILKKCRVEYIATTDDPASPLTYHGTYGGTKVSPTFRPDSALGLDPSALAALGEAAEMQIDSLSALKQALRKRLDYFNAHGCCIADHGMDYLPAEDCGEEAAEALFAKGTALTAEEKHLLFSHLLVFLAAEYTRRGMVMQLHFATYRCVNSSMLPVTGKDSGFDIMRGHVDTDRLVAFLDTLVSRGALPRTVLYTLNPACAPSLATLTGAFPTVRVGAAWWFSDTVLGIKRQLETVAEYAVLGTNLGMLTDSRSFASYARFDFFRRILADVVGGYVERGEYDLAAARELMIDVCYRNVKEYLGL